MPAPVSGSIYNYLKAAFIAQGYYKRTYVNGVVVTDPTALPDEMDKMVQAIAAGLALQWAAWQAEQVVAVNNPTVSLNPVLIPPLGTGTLP